MPGSDQHRKGKRVRVPELWSLRAVSLERDPNPDPPQEQQSPSASAVSPTLTLLFFRIVFICPRIGGKKAG